MSRNLPPPATVTDFYMAAAVEILDEAVRLLGEIVNRLPESASVGIAGGPGTAPEVPVSTAEVAPAKQTDAKLVTEPAPTKPPVKAAKKTAAKAAQVKES